MTDGLLGLSMGVERAERGLQLTAHHQVATPADWQRGQDVIIVPAVTAEQARGQYPHGWREVKPYLRYVPDPGA